ncbi:MAG: hypothetical protein WAO28_02240 [Candidatus Microsaccharimonas sp.]
MPEVPQSEDPLPKKHDSLSARVTRFHAENQQLGGTYEYVVTDERDPFVWKAHQVNDKDVNFHIAKSEPLRHLMWAAYRLIGTLPSEDEVAKIRDTETFNPAIEQRLIAALSDNDREVLRRYHNFLLANSATLESPVAQASEAPSVESRPRSKKEEMLAAIFEHMDILKLQKESSEVDKGSTSVDIS